MKVELAQIPIQGGLKVKTGKGTFAASLKEGDSIKAEVLSSGKDSVLLKTAAGQTLRARLDPDIMFSPGDTVMLEVTDVDAGILSLSIREEGDAEDTAEITEQPTEARTPEDKSLLTYMNKLTELNMPVTKEAAQLMKELIAQNPSMTLDEAAFIAANKLAGDENLIKAAISILSDGDKTDAMIERLLALLQETESSNSELGIRNSELPETEVRVADSQTEGDSGFDGINSDGQENPADNFAFRIPHSASEGNPLTEWVAMVEDGSITAAEAFLRGTPTDAQSANDIIPQTDANMQSTILENSKEMMNFDISLDETGDTNAEFGMRNAELPNAEFGVRNSELPETEVRAADSQAGAGGSENIIGKEQENHAGYSEVRIPNSESATQPQGTELEGKPQSSEFKMAELLSEIPEFQSTPAPALERFSNMLLRVAGDSADASSGDLEKLQALLEKMFTRIEISDKDSGIRLKSAKEELFARLAFIEEAIARAEPPAKTVMLEQTRRLMDHVRLLNNIDQFAYLQLPVQIGEERKTAELYLFKKKGGKRLDPENVNILLALDLETLGHWEGLINFRGKDVSIKMEVAGPKEKEHFSNNTVLLHELLSEAGFKLVSTDITHSKTETTPLTALSVLGKHTTGRAAVDFMV